MLISHNNGSGVELARASGIAYFVYSRWRAGRRFFSHRRNLRVTNPWVNWGLQPAGLRAVLNHIGTAAPAVLNADIHNAVSKIRAFRKFQEHGIPHPHVYASAQEAQDSGEAFLGRADHMHSGMGITVYEPGSVPARHDFYTKLIRRRHEYRVHVWRGVILATQYKAMPEGIGVVGTHLAGARFITRDLTGKIGPNNTSKSYELAIGAVEALGLDFGAVDFISDGPNRRDIYVLEVNTAPGIEAPSTLEAYSQAIRSIIQE